MHLQSVQAPSPLAAELPASRYPSTHYQTPIRLEHC